MRTPRVLLVAALLLGALTACSSGAPGVSPSLSSRLEQEVRGVADLAAAHQYRPALAALSGIRTSVRTAVASGQLPADRAARIGAALDLVQHDLSRAATPTTPASPYTPVPRPTTTAPVSPAAVSTQLSEEQRKAQEKAAERARKRAEEQAKQQDEKHHDEKHHHEDDEGDD